MSELAGGWIPLVEQREGRFVLSNELLEIVGMTGWGYNLWEVKAFVAHLITSFEDGFEHFLDNADDEYPYFRVSEAFCAHLASRFKDEFLPVSAEWYRTLAEAKLLTLRVPRSLVTEAKLAYHQSTHHPAFVVRGLIEAPARLGTPVSERLTAQLTESLEKQAEELWETIESAAKEIVTSGVLTTDDLWDLFTVWDEDEYARFIQGYQHQ